MTYWKQLIGIEGGDSLASPGLRLRAGIAWNFVAVFFNQGSTLAINIVVARLLGRETFGEYAMLYSTLVVISIVAQLSTGYTSTKYVAEFRTVDKEKAGRLLTLCFLVSAVSAAVGASALLWSSSWIASVVLRAPHLVLGLKVGSVFLFFSTINGYQMGALAGLEGYRGLAKAGVASGLTALLGVSLGAYAYGLNGAMIGLALTALLRCLLHNVWLRRELSRQGFGLRFDGLGNEGAILYRFALPVAIMTYLSFLTIWIANLLLVRRPNGYAQMALYSAATSIRLLVLFLPNVINSVGLSVLNNERGKGDLRRYREVFRVNVTMICLAVLIPAMALAIGGNVVLGVFGRSFHEGYPVLVLLLLSTIPEGLSMGLYQLIQSQEKMWLSFALIVVPREIVFVTLAYALTRQYGAFGLAGAYLIAVTLGLVSHSAMVLQLTKKQNIAAFA
ncbi:MAG: oligosaccharide flippase family protein [Acidobacteriia bacterium]|nr:oligosaccharide flippase family protein [Terriglobia bacterium]